MPIYEYRCSECGHRLEALQRLADTPLIECPACSKKSLVKLISAVGFQLKGSGWYATDFKHSGSKPADKAAAKPDGGGGEGASTDAKGEGAPSTEKSDAQPPATASSESKASTDKTTGSDSKPSTAAPAKPAATG